MQRLSKKILLTLISIIFLSNSSMLFAEAVLNIMPSLLSMNLNIFESKMITFTVTNDTKHPINQLVIDPAYQSQANSSEISVQANTCNGISLAPNKNCTFQLLVNGANQPNQFSLRPQVCGYNGAVCSVPISDNAVQFGILTTPMAYITNFNSNTVSICPINTNGSLATCSVSNLGGALNGPAAITLNMAGTLAYITNFNTNTVSVCPLSSNGSLSTCSSYNPGSTFNGPAGVAINTLGTWIYVVNYSNNTLSMCPLNANGLPGTACTASDPGSTFNFPDYVVLNASGTFAYVTNSHGGTVSVCPTNPSGILGTCTAFADPTFAGAAGFAFNGAGTFGYIVNGQFPSQTVSLCPINSNGMLSACTALISATFLNNNFGKIAINAPWTFAYVVNQHSNYVSVCPLNANATFGTCTISADSSFNEPQGIAIL